MIYFTADLHFNHTNIMKFCGRNFVTVEDMNETIIENWNKTVTNNDEVYIIGDFAFVYNYETFYDFLKKLNGRKYFVKGNHDKMKFIKQAKDDKLIEEYYDNYKEINIDNYRITLSHFPMFEWNNCYRNGILLFGHIHNSYVEIELENIMNTTKHKSKYYYNVGVDTNNLTPVSWKYLKEYFENKK